MLVHLDSPYIRALGFLYLRYTCPPADLWQYFKPFVYDNEEFTCNSRKDKVMKIGEYVRFLITDIEFFGTILPRLPVPIQRDYKVKLLQANENNRRSLRNEADSGRVFFEGAKVMGLYEDDENPLQWYDGIISTIEKAKEQWERNKYWITFPEYGNTELLTMGEVETMANFERYGPGMVGGEAGEAAQSDLMEEVMRKDREQSAAAGGKGGYSRPPTSFKGSMQASGGGYYGGGADGAKPTGGFSGAKRDRDDRDRGRRGVKRGKPDSSTPGSANFDHQPPVQQRREKSADELKQIEEKKKMLASRYG